MTTATIELFRTATGQRLHIPACYHVHGVALLEATDEDRAALEVCSWCQAELDGVGRTPYLTVREALIAFGAYGDTWTTIERLLADVEHDEVWIPNSQSYVALGHRGRGVAWFGKTYVQVRGGAFIPLPGYAPGSGPSTERQPRYGDLCPICNQTRSLSGACWC